MREFFHPTGLRRFVACAVLVVFLLTSVVPPSFAQMAPWMPQPGTPVALSPAFIPAHLKGMVIDPKAPFHFDFIVDTGDRLIPDAQKQEEYQKLIRYFLAALAVPDQEQWVNLSPYEKDRIIPDSFALTGMGQDLLAQDYLLKQVASSLSNPEEPLGQTFWREVYAQAQEKFGTTDVPASTINKVWIIPDKAEMYEKDNTVLIVDSHLKVMLEEDYLAIQKGAISDPSAVPQVDEMGKMTSRIMREIIIPAIEKEINEGENFAPLRQVVSGMILATWYKMRLKETVLARLYADKAKVKGIDQDPKINQEIFNQYVEAFQKGVFNMIREDIDPLSREIIPRKYFSGGFINGDKIKKAMTFTDRPQQAMMRAKFLDAVNCFLKRPGDPDAEKAPAPVESEASKKIKAGRNLAVAQSWVRSLPTYDKATDKSEVVVDFEEGDLTGDNRIKWAVLKEKITGQIIEYMKGEVEKGVYDEAILSELDFEHIAMSLVGVEQDLGTRIRDQETRKFQETIFLRAARDGNVYQPAMMMDEARNFSGKHVLLQEAMDSVERIMLSFNWDIESAHRRESGTIRDQRHRAESTRLELVRIAERLEKDNLSASFLKQVRDVAQELLRQEGSYGFSAIHDFRKLRDGHGAGFFEATDYMLQDGDPEAQELAAMRDRERLPRVSKMFWSYSRPGSYRTTGLTDFLSSLSADLGSEGQALQALVARIQTYPEKERLDPALLRDVWEAVKGPMMNSKAGASIKEYFYDFLAYHIGWEQQRFMKPFQIHSWSSDIDVVGPAWIEEVFQRVQAGKKENVDLLNLFHDETWRKAFRLRQAASTREASMSADLGLKILQVDSIVRRFNSRVRSSDENDYRHQRVIVEEAKIDLERVSRESEALSNSFKKQVHGIIDQLTRMEGMVGTVPVRSIFVQLGTADEYIAEDGASDGDGKTRAKADPLMRSTSRYLHDFFRYQLSWGHYLGSDSLRGLLENLSHDLGYVWGADDNILSRLSAGLPLNGDRPSLRQMGDIWDAVYGPVSASQLGVYGKAKFYSFLAYHISPEATELRQPSMPHAAWARQIDAQGKDVVERLLGREAAMTASYADFIGLEPSAGDKPRVVESLLLGELLRKGVKDAYVIWSTLVNVIYEQNWGDRTATLKSREELIKEFEAKSPADQQKFVGQNMALIRALADGVKVLTSDPESGNRSIIEALYAIAEMKDGAYVMSNDSPWMTTLAQFAHATWATAVWFRGVEGGEKKSTSVLGGDWQSLPDSEKEKDFVLLRGLAKFLADQMTALQAQYQTGTLEDTAGYAKSSIRQELDARVQRLAGRMATEADQERLRKALYTSMFVHRHALRADGETPYFAHILDTVEALSEIVGEEEAPDILSQVIAAYHDTREDEPEVYLQIKNYVAQNIRTKEAFVRALSGYIDRLKKDEVRNRDAIARETARLETMKAGLATDLARGAQLRLAARILSNDYDLNQRRYAEGVARARADIDADLKKYGAENMSEDDRRRIAVSVFYIRAVREPRKVWEPVAENAWYDDYYVRDVQLVKLADILANARSMKNLVGRPEAEFAWRMNKIRVAIMEFIAPCETLTFSDKTHFRDRLLKTLDDYRTLAAEDSQYAPLADEADQLARWINTEWVDVKGADNMAPPVWVDAASQDAVEAVVDNGAGLTTPVKSELAMKPEDFSAANLNRRQFLGLTAAAAAATLLAPKAFLEAAEEAEGPSDTLIGWLEDNVFEDGMPRSWKLPGTLQERLALWKEIGARNEAGAIERRMINHSLNFYDGSAGVIASVFNPRRKNFNSADTFFRTLRSGSWGELQEIRAWDPKYHTYGKGKKILGRDQALYYRTMSNKWKDTDPLTGEESTWKVWDPVVGENAWIVMAAVQTAYAKSNGQVSGESDELKQAESIIPAFMALTDDTGAVHYVPDGVAGRNTDDISNENNFSVYAALRMLEQITTDPNKKKTYQEMMAGIRRYMKDYGLNTATGVLYQGGMYDGKQFRPDTTFAVDVQTWGILSFTPEKIDEMYGPGAAYRMWAETKRRSGYYQDGNLFGVGYTDGHDVFSGEWTGGAIAACLELAVYYQDLYKASGNDADRQRADEVLSDAVSMVKGLESLSRVDEGGRKGYLYVNKSVQIPFGWNGRPVESTAATSWAWYVQNFMDPFRLGGKTRWQELDRFRDAVDAIKSGKVGSQELKPVAAAPVQEIVVSSKDMQEAQKWINDEGFRSAAAGRWSEAYKELVKMGERAVPALTRNLLDHKAHRESRKWSAQILLEVATQESAPAIFWAIQEFQRTAESPEERWIANVHQGTAPFDTLRRKFGPIQPRPVSYVTEKAMGLEEAPSVREKAMEKGGVDLNSANLDMQIRRDGNGMVLPVSQQDLEHIKIDGLVPVILKIEPASTLPLFSQLEEAVLQENV